MEKQYLKDVLPRLYRETENWLACEWPDLLEQLPHLFITGRCSCGGCSDFYVDSDISELSREGGSSLLLRPLYYSMNNGFFLGISGKAGQTNGTDEHSYISGFELGGGDYEDSYIHRRLNGFGFRLDRPPLKRKRADTSRRRRPIFGRPPLRNTSIKPLSPSGKFLRKRRVMKRKN